MAIFDLDYFKKVNDTYGHLVGDDVLKGFAALVLDLKRDQDIFCRYGGEEFVIILPHTTLQGAEMLANRLCQIVQAHPFQLKNGEKLHVTISVGIYSDIPTPQNHWENLIEYADAAMYIAKKRGRNQAVVYQSVKNSSN